MSPAPVPPSEEAPVLALLLGGESYGIRRSWLGLFRSLGERGVAVRAVALREGEMADAARRAGVQTRCLEFPAESRLSGGARKFLALLRRGAQQLRVISPLRAEIARHRAAAIIVQSPLEVIVAGIAARRSGVPAYWLMPNSVSSNYPLDLNRRLYRFAFRHLNVVPVANSHYTDATLGPGIFRRHVCHLGIDPAEFDPGLPPAVSREQLGIPQDAVLLGVLARMTPEKGQGRMVEALGRMGAEAENVHLLLCGGPLDGDYYEELGASIARMGLQHRVHLTGPVDDVRSHTLLCDVAVNSRLDPEPFGLSVIEGMMLGKPVLAHRAGGPGETVIDGVTGWHVASPSVEDFEAGIRRMLADIPRLAEMGAAARSHALEHFTDRKMAARLIEIMAEPSA